MRHVIFKHYVYALQRRAYALAYCAMTYLIWNTYYKCLSEWVTQNLIRIAVSVIKSKSAAQHFESQIAAHVSSGSDRRDLGHSPDHFKEIMAAISAWIDRQTAIFLLNLLE